ncbi:hypothetical protein [Candidatus Neptunochlamydia vexilliferae]|nr:hypothetical protein [Candidatus Neptunochlamydia vexilliferae]
MLTPFCRSMFIGGIIAFIWSCFSWMVLPWHSQAYQAFENESAVAKVIVENVKESGIYGIPNMSNCEKPITKEEKHAQEEAWKKGPIIFTTVNLEGVSSGMVKEILSHLITTLIGSGIISFLLIYMAKPLEYWHKVLFVTFIGLAGAILNQIPLWIWHSFSAGFVTLDIIDQVVAWFLAGTAMAFSLRKLKN